MLCKDDLAEIVPAVLICSSFDSTDSWSNGLPTGKLFAVFDFEFASEQETRVRWITAHVCAPTEFKKNQLYY